MDLSKYIPQKLSKIAKTALVISATGALIAPFNFSSAAFAETDPDHKPGYASPDEGRFVPKDLMVDAKSPFARPGETPDASGKVHHICAGKKLLYQAHIDAIYTTKFNGKLTTTIVDGSSVMKDPESACLRLAPDAKKDGVEVSRMVVPDDKKYRFLGKPGHIVWTAPVVDYDWEKRPVWAGIGAFDVTHEVKQPTDVRDNVIQQWMEVEKAPGYVELWVPSFDSIRHLFSSQGYAIKTAQQNTGLHGHLNWSFSKAGVYRLKFTSSYIQKGTNKEVVSAPMHQVWLVGSDAEVGLPKDFTKDLRPILKTAEEVRAEQGLPTPEGDPVAQPDDKETNDGKVPQSPNKAELEKEATKAWNSDLPVNRYENGKYNMVGKADTTTSSDVSSDIQLVEGDKNVKEAATSFDTVFEVPDSMIRQIPKTSGTDNLYKQTKNGWLWVLSKTAKDSISLGWDTRQIDYNNIDGTVNLSLGKNSAPADSMASYVGWSKDNSGNITANLLASTLERTENWIRIQKPTTGVEDLVFTKPGIYTIDMNMKLFYKKPFVSKNPFIPDETNTITQNNTNNMLYFAVGNAAINYTREKMHEKAVADAKAAGKQPPAAPQMLPTDKYPAPKLPESTGVDNTPAPTPAPQDGKLHDLSKEEAEKLAKENFANAKRTLIPVGHIDHVLSFAKNAQGEPIAHWSHLGKEKEYKTDTFIYAVTNNFLIEDITSQGLPKEVASGFKKGAYYLPQALDPDNNHAPWTGFSTEYTDFTKISAKHPQVTVSLEDVTGPGRLVIGQNDGFGTTSVWFDSTNPKLTQSWPKRTHTHPITFFSQPGAYSANLVFSYMPANGGEKQVRKLKVHWAVGSALVNATKPYSDRVPTESDDSNKPSVPGKNSAKITLHNDKGSAVTQIKAGEKLIIKASGFTAHKEVTFTLHSTPVTLGKAMVDANGNLSFLATIPANTSAGKHTILAVQANGDKPLSASTTLEVKVVTAKPGTTTPGYSTTPASGHTKELTTTGVQAISLIITSALLLLIGAGLVRHRKTL